MGSMEFAQNIDIYLALSTSP